MGWFSHLRLINGGLIVVDGWTCNGHGYGCGLVTLVIMVAVASN